VAVAVDVIVGGGVGTVVPMGLIVASVGLVQPAKSAHNMSTNVATRNTVYFMKNAFVFFIFPICAPGVIKKIAPTREKEKAGNGHSACIPGSLPVPGRASFLPPLPVPSEEWSGQDRQ
jgi:hypothetical protein